MNQRDINEKKLFEQFHNRSMPVSNDVWDSISGKLDEKNKKKRRPILLWWFAGLFLIIIGYTTLARKLNYEILPDIETNNKSIQNSPAVIVSDNSHIQNNYEKNEKVSSEEINELKSAIEVKDQVIVKGFSNTPPKTGLSDRKTKNIKSNFASKLNDYRDKISDLIINQNSNSHPLYSKSSESDKAGSTDPMNILNHPSFLISSQHPPQIKSKPISFLAGEERLIETTHLASESKITHQKKLEKFIQLSSGIGIPIKNLSSNNTDTQIIQYRTSTETPLYTWNFNLLMGLKLNKTWSVSTGLQVTQIKEKFDYINESATRIEVKIDSSTQTPGDANLVRGKLIETGENTISLINIPVSIGYQKRIGSWTAGIDLGLGFNIYTTAKGKILMGDQDVRPVTSIPDLYKRKVGMNAQLSLNFQRKVSKNMSLLIEPQYVKYLSDWTSSNQTKLSYDLINLQIGLIKYF